MKNETMNFSDALNLLKSGESLARQGWNGKGMYVYLEPNLELVFKDGIFKGQKRIYKPVFVLFNAQKEHQMGWLPSQGDLLSDDWVVV
jgi:hypothetical protein